MFPRHQERFGSLVMLLMVLGCSLSSAVQLPFRRIKPLLSRLKHHELVRLELVGVEPTAPKADAIFPEAVEVKMTAFGKFAHLKLQKNTELFSPRYEHRLSTPDGGWTVGHDQPHCYYHGEVKGRSRTFCIINVD